jgi:regulation of enolase protein 1 (concanavalin A-like superfamily)
MVTDNKPVAAGLRWLLMGVAYCLFTGVAAAQDKTSQTVGGWGIVTDPAGDCTVKAKNGKLTVTVPGAVHDLNARAGGMGAPRILSEIEGDFAVQVKVTGEFKPGEKSANPRSTPFNGAGLLIWQDEKNYLRLERNIYWLQQVGKYACYPPLVEYYKDGEYQRTNPQPKLYEQFFKGQSTWLRLERHGNKAIASYSHDGKQWTVAKEIPIEFPGKVSVGVAAVNTSAEPFTVEFEDLELTTVQLACLIDERPSRVLESVR